MKRGRQGGEARHEHTQFAEVKRARDAVFDFGTHDYAFFAEVGSSVSSQGQPGLAPGGATHSKCPLISADVEDSSDLLSV